MASELRVNTLKDASGNNSIATSFVAGGSAKAWAEIGSGGSSLPDSFNISSLDDDSTGEYGLNFSSAMTNANYSATAVLTKDHSQSPAQGHRVTTPESKTTSSLEVSSGFVNTNGEYIDFDIDDNGNYAIHGDLA